jgi:hypothetical protein
MRDDVAARLLEIAEGLERDAKATAGYGLDDTAKLLRMARLDLLCRIHGISDRELRAISDGLNRPQPIGEVTAMDAPRLKLPH